MLFQGKLFELLEKRGHPIRVGLVGAGQMGSGLVSQIEQMKGIEITAIADIVVDNAVSAYRKAGIRDNEMIKNEKDPNKISNSIKTKKRIVTEYAQLITEIPEIEIIVEATGVPEVGAEICHRALLNRKHVVNMNVETDVVVGYYLNKMAQTSGLIYTLITGDEPGAIKELFDFAILLGFEVISVGKGKNNILDVTATPESVKDLAEKKNMNPRMLTSFIDGTKTMAELTSIANGIGFPPDVRGAHGPEVLVKDLVKTFIPQEFGGIHRKKYVVDYAVGKDVAPGVFIIVTSDHPVILDDMRYLNSKYGHGNFWSIYRPYHLCNLEAPISILRAYFDHDVTLATNQKPVAELISIAKRDLHKGETIDDLGGFTVYGSIENADIAYEEGLVPLGLIAGSRILKDIPKGNPIHYSDVNINTNQTIFHLRMLQDKVLELESKY